MKYPWVRGLFLALIFSTVSLFATGFEAFEQDEPAVRAELIVEDSSIQPGRPFWVGIRLQMEPEWHVYWKNPGQAGMPTEVFWELPEGFQVSELKWPAPQRYESHGMVSFGYEKDVVLLAEVTPPSELPLGSDIELAAEVTWVACHSACIPGDAFVSTTLPVSRFSPASDLSHAERIRETRARLPRLEESVIVERTEGGIRLSWESPAHYGVERLVRGQLFSDEYGNVSLGAASGSHGTIDGVTVVDILIDEEDAELPAVLSGVLRLEDSSGEWFDGIQVQARFAEDSLTAASSEEAAALPSSALSAPLNESPASVTVSGFILALAGAFLGGLLLNLMPCVLPVISLKILGFVKMAGKEQRHAFMYGLAFTSGVLVSFWVLAGALIALKASGSAVGWGFQLQEPAFIAGMCFVLVLVALNFFGVFEMGTSVASMAGSKGSKGSTGLGAAFSSGVLATALATPCTGPFLGTAIGFAATLSPLASLGIFTAIALGMAFPYLLLSSFPSLMKYLPKPGNWMIAFKQSMGFVMLATVIWLLWVFTALTHGTTVFYLLAYLLLAAFGAWIYGCWGSPINRPVTRRVASILALAVIVAAVVPSFQLARAPIPSSQLTATAAVPGQAPTVGDWHAFSEANFSTLRKEGVPVFVDFTARWCLICQANKITLRDQSVKEHMDKLGIVRFEADWTRRDPTITKFLAKFGRNGVPLYIYFPADPEKEPTILPQALTPEMVIGYLGDQEDEQQP
jgi:thiol:disulfide interchange protein DsbD